MPRGRDDERARGSTGALATIFGVALVMSLGACATRPLGKLSEPAFDMPARFDIQGAAPLSDRWWQAFDDPALNGLINQALSNNFTLASAYARVQQAEATVASQRSGLFPTLTGRASESVTHREQGGNSGGGLNLGDLLGSGAAGGGAGNDSALRNLTLGSSDNSDWTTSRRLGLSASYEIDLFGRIRNGLEAAKLSRQSLQSALQSAAVTLAGNIASQWYSYQELDARVALLKSQIDTNQNVLDLTTFSFNNGQAAAADVLRQRQTVEASQAQLAQARAQAAVARHALAVLVGVSSSTFDPPAGKLVALPPLPATGVPSTLLMRRPDVRQQYYTLASDNRQVAVALANRYPQLSLSADYSGVAHPSAMFADWILQLGAQITQPIFDGGERRAAIRQAQAVVDEDVADYQQTLLEALQEVDDALVNERQQTRYLQRLNKQLDISKDVVANLRLRYLRGATSYLDVLDALLNRQQLQVDQLTGKRQLLDYRINLYRALAGSIDDPTIGIRQPLAGRSSDGPPSTNASPSAPPPKSDPAAARSSTQARS